MLYSADCFNNSRLSIAQIPIQAVQLHCADVACESKQIPPEALVVVSFRESAAVCREDTALKF